jgi:hypothetical protein
VTEKEFHFWQTCVGWPEEEMELLHEIIANARSVVRSTFLKHCDCDPKDIPLTDWHVGYFRSNVAGVTYYFYDHSLIEHVFREG